jgi:hypothetical protein
MGFPKKKRLVTNTTPLGIILNLAWAKKLISSSAIQNI